MAPRQTSDITARDFRDALRQHGFVEHALIDRFSDSRNPKAGTVKPVRTAKGKLKRRLTLDRLLTARQAAEAEQAAARADQQRREQTAASIAPHVLPPCRADLTGPAAIAQLADDFVLALTTSEGITHQALIQKGWRSAQLAEHAEAARTLADRRQTLVLA